MSSAQRAVRSGAAALLAVVLTACGSATNVSVRGGTSEGSDPPAATPADGSAPTRNPAQRYRVTATVLEDRTHGPQLCAGDIATSLPPGCGGPDVEPFNWNDVEGEQALSGTTWAEFDLVGTFDGQTFHLTAKPQPSSPAPADPATSGLPTACPEPAGGWPAPDPAKTTEKDLEALFGSVSAQPDGAGAWLSWSGPPAGNGDYHTAIANVAFTGDLPRHEQEARTRWGGRLCVTRMARPRAQLTRVNDDLAAHQAEARAAGVDILSSGTDEPANVVRLDVLISDAVSQQWVDQRYGPGVVVLHGRLEPVDTPAAPPTTTTTAAASDPPSPPASAAPPCRPDATEPSMGNGYCGPEPRAGNGDGPDGLCTGHEAGPPCGPGVEEGRWYPYTLPISCDAHTIFNGQRWASTLGPPPAAEAPRHVWIQLYTSDQAGVLSPTMAVGYKLDPDGPATTCPPPPAPATR